MWPIALHKCLVASQEQNPKNPMGFIPIFSVCLHAARPAWGRRSIIPPSPLISELRSWVHFVSRGIRMKGWKIMPRTNIPEPCSGEVELWAFPLKLNRNVALGLGRMKHLKPLSSLPWLLKIIVAKNKNIPISKGQWGNRTRVESHLPFPALEEGQFYHGIIIPASARTRKSPPPQPGWLSWGMRKNSRKMKEDSLIAENTSNPAMLWRESTLLQMQSSFCHSAPPTPQNQNYSELSKVLTAATSRFDFISCIQQQGWIQGWILLWISSPSHILGALLRTQHWSAEEAHTGCLWNHSRWFLKVCFIKEIRKRKKKKQPTK